MVTMMDSLFPEFEASRAEASRVHVGTSGFSFRDWVGPFYPPGVPARKHLEFYAAHFDCLELNMSYYRMPEAKALASMSDRTPRHFEFIVKLHADITHQQTNDDTLYRQFDDALKPLRQDEKLHGLLAQFPNGFHNSEKNRAFLSRLRHSFPGDDLFVELRHSSWMHEAVFDFFRKLGLGYVSVDEPQIEGLLPPVARATNDIAYVRLHGRNKLNWYDGPERQGDRYDYLYNETELQEWAEKVRKLLNDSRRVFVFFNNCHAGKAPANAQAFRDLLDSLGIG